MRAQNVYTIIIININRMQKAKGNIENDALKMQPMTKYDTLLDLHTVLYILFYSQRKGKINDHDVQFYSV